MIKQGCWRPSARRALTLGERFQYLTTPSLQPLTILMDHIELSVQFRRIRDRTVIDTYVSPDPEPEAGS